MHESKKRGSLQINRPFGLAPLKGGNPFKNAEPAERPRLFEAKMQAHKQALGPPDIFGTPGPARSDAFVGREYRDAPVNHSDM